MIRIKIETIPFAESFLAKWLIKLARWNNWNVSYGQYISYSRWNFRLASKIATAIKTWEENKEATKFGKSLNPATVKKATRPIKGVLDFPVNDRGVIDAIITEVNKHSKLDNNSDEP